MYYNDYPFHLSTVQLLSTWSINVLRCHPYWANIELSKKMNTSHLLRFYPFSLSLSPLSPLSQCDANPDATKLVVQEDKYENVLTLIIYYQMVSNSYLDSCEFFTRITISCLVPLASISLHFFACQ